MSSIATFTLANVVAAGPAAYFPSYVDKNGKFVNQRALLSAFINPMPTRSGDFPTERQGEQIDLVFWGKPADSVAVYINKGKSISAAGTVGSYWGPVKNNAGEIVTQIASGREKDAPGGNAYQAGQTIPISRWHMSLKVSGMPTLGVDSSESVAKRPAGWNVPGTKGKEDWDAQNKENHRKYVEGYRGLGDTYGNSKVYPVNGTPAYKDANGNIVKITITAAPTTTPVTETIPEGAIIVVGGINHAFIGGKLIPIMTVEAAPVQAAVVEAVAATTEVVETEADTTESAEVPVTDITNAEVFNNVPDMITVAKPVDDGPVIVEGL